MRKNSKFSGNKHSIMSGTNAVIGMPWLKAQIGRTVQPNKEVLAYYGNQFKLENNLYSAKTK